jgi:hypothetical protein
MNIHSFFSRFQDTGFGYALRESNHLVGAALQEFHILGFLLLLAAVLLVNLRLFGLGLRTQPVHQVTSAGSKLLWIGAVTAMASGLLIFLSGPVRYLDNDAFVYKMGILTLAVILQLVIHKAVTKDTLGAASAKVIATLSLSLWFGVGIAGRAIGFV